jgi:chemotaxis protein methyltransferase CheR
MDNARAAFARGDYARAAELTRGLTADAGACALHVRALANVEAARAERACAAAAARHPLSAELHHLHAVLLLELARDDEAARAARRVIYLDRSLAVGHFTLGSILWRRGDRAGARRAYGNARDLCAARPADEVVPLADGEPAGRLAEAAAAQLAVLDAAPEVSP